MTCGFGCLSCRACRSELPNFPGFWWFVFRFLGVFEWFWWWFCGLPSAWCFVWGWYDIRFRLVCVGFDFGGFWRFCAGCLGGVWFSGFLRCFGLMVFWWFVIDLVFGCGIGSLCWVSLAVLGFRVSCVSDGFWLSVSDWFGCLVVISGFGFAFCVVFCVGCIIYASG